MKMLGQVESCRGAFLSCMKRCMFPREATWGRFCVGAGGGIGSSGVRCGSVNCEVASLMSDDACCYTSGPVAQPFLRLL